jgi:hypothetical protein
MPEPAVANVCAIQCKTAELSRKIVLDFCRNLRRKEEAYVGLL